MQNLIFILGAPRSGTTLVLGALVKHQSLIGGVFGESQFYGTLFQEAYHLDNYLKNKYWLELLTEEEISPIFHKSSNHIEFFKQAVSYYLNKHDKSFFAEKSPIHTLFYKQILTDFENPIFIVITRDPAAVIHSMTVTSWIPLFPIRFEYLNNYTFLKYWVGIYKYYRYHKALKKIKKLPNSSYIKYEDIIEEKVDMQDFFEKTLQVSLDPIYISRPFSPEASNKYSFDKSRVYGYKNKVPKYFQYIIHKLFLPKNHLERYLGSTFLFFLFEPIIFFRKLLGNALTFRNTKQLK